MIAADFRMLRRGRLDMTQGELAGELGITSRTISAYESGEAPIPYSMALAIECLVLRREKEKQSA